MNPISRRSLLCLLTILCMSGACTAAFALEGAYTDSHRDWRDVPAPRQPDAAERARELDARKAAIAADIQRLNDRLKHAPDAATAARIKARLEAIDKAYGWVPEIQMVFGRRAIEPMVRGQDALPPLLLEAFVQLKKDLESRGADLIIVPLVPTPFFATHLIVEGATAQTEVYPGWTKMMIQMLEADLEVIDTVDEFRQEAANDILVSWVNDFHTGSLGRQIAAQALAKRLQRYAFARELAGNRELWDAQVKERTGAMYPQRITTVNGMFREVNRNQVPAGARTYPVRHPGKVNILASGAPDLEQAMAERKFKYIDLKEGPKVTKDLLRKDLVMIGDSQLHSAVYGSGFPEFVMREVGGKFRWGSKSWSGFSPPEIFLEVVPAKADQPRVVVLTFLPKYFWNSYHGEKVIEQSRYRPRPMPAVRRAVDAASTSDTALPTEPFAIRVKVTEVSAKRDPSKLDYDHAIAQTVATVVEGPKALVGQTIGLRYWVILGRAHVPAAAAVKKGQVLSVTVRDWSKVIEAEPSLATHMIFADAELDLDAAFLWVTAGPLHRPTPAAEKKD